MCLSIYIYYEYHGNIICVGWEVSHWVACLKVAIDNDNLAKQNWIYFPHAQYWNELSLLWQSIREGEKQQITKPNWDTCNGNFSSNSFMHQLASFAGFPRYNMQIVVIII